MRILVRPGCMAAIQAMLSVLTLLTILSIAYFVLALIDAGCLDEDARIFSRHIWAWFHVGILAASGALYIAYLAEAGVLQQVTLASAPDRAYNDLYHYYRMLVHSLVISFLLSGAFIIPAAFIKSFDEERFKQYLEGFPLGWIPMFVPLLFNLVQVCRLWSKLE